MTGGGGGAAGVASLPSAAGEVEAGAGRGWRRRRAEVATMEEGGSGDEGEGGQLTIALEL